MVRGAWHGVSNAGAVVSVAIRAGGDLVIRLAAASDRAAVWAVLEKTIRAGETLTLPREMGAADAVDYWLGGGHEAFVAEIAGAVVGTYYLQANRDGGGAHVANAGYVTGPAARGMGVARAMGAHSLARARARGFAAMQFNFVVSTNERAVRLWTGLGFAVVGRLPGAFAHPTLGYVDALVMYQAL